MSGFVGRLPVGKRSHDEAVRHQRHFGFGGTLGAPLPPRFEECHAGRRHGDAPYPSRLGGLLATFVSCAIDRASDADRVVLDVGPAQCTELPPTCSGEDGEIQQHSPAFVVCLSSSEELANLVNGRHHQFGALDRRRLRALGGVSVEPAPAHRLTQGSREDCVVPTDAGRLECPRTPDARSQLSVPLVELSGGELCDPEIAELGEDDRLGRAPGIVESSRGAPPSVAVPEPFVDQLADGDVACLNGFGLIELLLPLAKSPLRFGLVLGVDVLADLSWPTGRRIRTGEDTELPSARASLSNRSGTLGSSRSPGVLAHA